MRNLLIIMGLFPVPGLWAQPQTDFRGLLSVSVEKKINPDFSATFMGAGILTYDFQEIGFAWVDAGVKYRLTRHIGVNTNYRLLVRRNLDNFYDNRHLLYADVDVSKGYGRWAVGGTARFQGLFYSHIIEGYRRPLFYNRDKINLKYKINYYWQPFIEAEFFFPLNHPVRKRLDQVRGSIGISYTFNRHVKIEIYQQFQQQLARRNKNINILTAINWSLRF